MWRSRNAVARYRPDGSIQPNSRIGVARPTRVEAAYMHHAISRSPKVIVMPETDVEGRIPRATPAAKRQERTRRYSNSQYGYKSARYCKSTRLRARAPRAEGV